MEAKAGSYTILAAIAAWLVVHVFDVFHGVDGASVMLVIPTIDKIGCTEKRLSPTCSQVCEKRNDTVAVMFRDMIPCSELPWYYDRRNDPWFCREFNVSDFDNSVPFILASLESAYNFYYFGDKLAMKRFSACQGYHRSCQWMFSFVADPLSGLDLSGGGKTVLDQLRNPTKRLEMIYEKVGGQAFVAQVKAAMNASVFYMASNINAQASGRSQLVHNLQKYIPVDAWGLDQLNVNRTFLLDYKSNIFYEGYEKLAIMAQYKFALAFENSFSTDYITEKLWGAFAVGVVPVVLVHESVYDYLPDRMAVINARDFNTTAALADYLKALLADEKLYQRHLEWKNRAFPEKFIKFIDNAASMTDDKVVLDICRTYKEAHKWKKLDFDDHRKEHWGAGVFIPTALPTLHPTSMPTTASLNESIPSAIPSAIPTINPTAAPSSRPLLSFLSWSSQSSASSGFYSLYLHFILAAVVSTVAGFKFLTYCCMRGVKPRFGRRHHNNQNHYHNHGSGDNA